MRELRLLSAIAVLSGAACESTANLDGKPCPCVTGYVCCKKENVCLRKDQACVDVGPWSSLPEPPPASLPLDDVTVYAFSQVNTNGEKEESIDDLQLVRVVPDLLVRGWAQWSHYGIAASDYQFSYIDRCHARGIRTFMGGVTATVLTLDQIPRADDVMNPDRDDLTSRDAENKILVRFSDDNDQIRRATLANPLVRANLIKIGKLQIDGGVDGLHFEEINGGYQGARPTGDGTAVIADGNEGFDRFHLADFNAYLLARNPAGTDFATLFGMTADNMLRSDVPVGDLARNFNYQKYLARNGWSQTPLIAGNPLAAWWGRTTVNRPQPGAATFVDSAEPYRYWKEIVQTLRDYARSHQGREILITAEGIYPFVDFQSVGLDDFNTDGPGGTVVHYLPVTAGGHHLDGTQSLQVPFRHLKALSEQFAPGVPVVLFLDGRWQVYDDFPEGSDRADFWRLYAAEAYANGLFFAFHLKSSVGKKAEKTADELGLTPLFTTLTKFYRTHAATYHGVAASNAAATTSLAPGNVMIAVNDQGTARRFVHLVNHVYQPGVGITPQTDVTVTVESSSQPVGAILSSPDWAEDIEVQAEFVDGQVTVTVPSLEAYVVVTLLYD